MTCEHSNTISAQQWAATDDCRDVVICLDCDEVIVSEPKGTEGSLLEQMRWLDD